ncbi:MAG: hypothetical protein KC503_17295 [Myxococcales bacterium]|nr:hypothetical protein [Myxococcales bacterium]
MTRYRFKVIDQGFDPGDPNEWGEYVVTESSIEAARDRAALELEDPEVNGPKRPRD